MQSLYSLAEAGATSLAVAGPSWPYTSYRDLLGPAAAGVGGVQGTTTAATKGAELVLGTFKRR